MMEEWRRILDDALLDGRLSREDFKKIVETIESLQRNNRKQEDECVKLVRMLVKIYSAAYPSWASSGLAVVERHLHTYINQSFRLPNDYRLKEIEQSVLEMHKVLYDNREKDEVYDWGEVDLRDVLIKLHEEFNELHREISRDDDVDLDKVISEAADVMAVCTIIIDNVKKAKRKIQNE